jgi:hypothetical protein
MFALPQDNDIIRGFTPSPASSCLPQKRRVRNPNATQTVMHPHLNQSQGGAYRPIHPMWDNITPRSNPMTPSIKKAMKERANFYRRKLTFYVNMQIMAVSMTSEEMNNKIRDAQSGLLSSSESYQMMYFSN